MKTLILGLTLTAFGTSAAFAQDVVRMGSEGAYPPYNFINDATGELDGFERELGDAICERAGLTCEWVINDWDTIIPNLVSGNYDTIMAGMSITEARKEVISFSQNYLQPEPSAFIALAETDADVTMSGVVSRRSRAPFRRATSRKPMPRFWNSPRPTKRFPPCAMARWTRYWPTRRSWSPMSATPLANWYSWAMTCCWATASAWAPAKATMNCAPPSMV